ncbi:putative RNA methyltransferase [Spongorhabdus nitratireducens]
MPQHLTCPICKDPLVATDNSIRCSNNHSFDRARQGYLNLLPSHHKRTVDPGDNKLMVTARNRFLDLGCYQKPARMLTEQISKLQSDSNDPSFCVLDAGCGEGYYTASVEKICQPTALYGLDISKNAIQACCRRSKSINWLVASVSNMPVADHSMDVIFSIFSRIDWAEFSRVLKPGGHVLALGPGSNHLLELRQAIYGEVRSYKTDKLLKELPESIVAESVTPVQDRFTLESSQAIQDLLAMTPHYWHIKPEQREKLEQLNILECTLDMQLFHFRYQP